MNTRKQIIQEIDGLLGLKSLVEVYQEVAATRMQRVRGAVLQSRLFSDGLIDVFSKVRSAYKKLKRQPKPLRKLNGKTVAVFVSANSGLYGEIVEKTYVAFEKFVLENKPDVVVLGRQGTKMLADRMSNIFYNYFDVPDEEIDMGAFDIIMRYLIQFERIVVFHGQFKSILSQMPQQTLVSGQSLDKGASESMEKSDYLFEPTVDSIARIFEGEIMASIFEQSLHESMLSKQASRMLSLDRSLDSVEHRLVKVHVEERQVLHRMQNRKQLSTISGLSLWG